MVGLAAAVVAGLKMDGCAMVELHARSLMSLAYHGCAPSKSLRTPAKAQTLSLWLAGKLLGAVASLKSQRPQPVAVPFSGQKDSKQGPPATARAESETVDSTAPSRLGRCRPSRPDRMLSRAPPNRESHQMACNRQLPRIVSASCCTPTDTPLQNSPSRQRWP